jgi:hypothetical protein
MGKSQSREDWPRGTLQETGWDCPQSAQRCQNRSVLIGRQRACACGADADLIL